MFIIYCDKCGKRIPGLTTLAFDNPNYCEFCASVPSQKTSQVRQPPLLPIVVLNAIPLQKRASLSEALKSVSKSKRKLTNSIFTNVVLSVGCAMFIILGLLLVSKSTFASKQGLVNPTKPVVASATASNLTMTEENRIRDQKCLIPDYPTRYPRIEAPSLVPILTSVHTEGAMETSCASPLASAKTTTQENVVNKKSPLVVITQNGDQGNILIEASMYSNKIARGGQDWVCLPKPSGDSLTGPMQALPNNGLTIDVEYAQKSPCLEYRINFSTTGTYYVWIRGMGATNMDNSCHIGLDGMEIPSASRFSLPRALGWVNQANGSLGMLKIPSLGLHTINLWMREDGVVVEKLLLTTDPHFKPN